MIVTEAPAVLDRSAGDLGRAPGGLLREIAAGDIAVITDKRLGRVVGLLIGPPCIRGVLEFLGADTSLLGDDGPDDR